MLAPSLVAVAVLVFIFSWNDYLFALVLSSSNATPITLGAANFVTSTGIRWGDISAATLLSTLPPSFSRSSPSDTWSVACPQER